MRFPFSVVSVRLGDVSVSMCVGKKKSRSCHPKYVNTDIFWRLRGVAFSTPAGATRRVVKLRLIGLQNQQSRAAANTCRASPYGDRVKLATGGVKVSA